MLTTSVDPLDLSAAATVHLGTSEDPFVNHLVHAMREASEDQLDVLERIYPDMVYAERTRRHDPKRLQAVAWVQPRNQCDECGWPMREGHRPLPGDDDVEGYGICTNPTCTNEY